MAQQKIKILDVKPSQSKADNGYRQIRMNYCCRPIRICMYMYIYMNTNAIALLHQFAPKQKYMHPTSHKWAQTIATHYAFQQCVLRISLEWIIGPFAGNLQVAAVGWFRCQIALSCLLSEYNCLPRLPPNLVLLLVELAVDVRVDGVAIDTQVCKTFGHLLISAPIRSHNVIHAHTFGICL